VIRRIQLGTVDRISVTLIIVLGLMSAGCGQVKDMLGISSKPSSAASTKAPDKAANGLQKTAAKGAAGGASKNTAGERAGTKKRTPAPRTPPTGGEADVTAQTALDGTPAAQALVTAPSVRNGAEPAFHALAPATTSRTQPPAPQPAFAGASSANDRSPIYSPADSDVIPARLLTSQKAGPLFRNAPADLNTMELIISKLGLVEQVRLTSPTKRMTDMLLLSGAKTWRFAPAMKDGAPVRYRTNFSWEMTP